MTIRDILKSVRIDLPLDDTERSVLANLLKYVIGSTAIMILAILPFVLNLVFTSPLRTGLTLAVFGVNLVGWLLLRRGYLMPTSAWLTIGYWIIVFILVLATGGLESPWVLAQVGVTVMAGLLLG